MSFFALVQTARGKEGFKGGPNGSGAWFEALRAGAERLQSRRELLDRINVFPVADGDTGVNMALTLEPLLEVHAGETDLSGVRKRIVLAARGNSGNLVSGFLDGMLSCLESGGWPGLQEAARRGRNKAYAVVGRPRQGTILDLMDLAATMPEFSNVEREPALLEKVCEAMEDVVQETKTRLEELSAAGVVDSGALGLYLFLQGVLYFLHDREPPVETPFDGMRVRKGWDAAACKPCSRYCLDAAVASSRPDDLVKKVRSIGESVEVVEGGGVLKLHVHTDEPERLKRIFSRAGDILSFSVEDMFEQVREFTHAVESGAVRPASMPNLESPWSDPAARVTIAVDAAASLDRQTAEGLGVVLFHSYVNLAGKMLPECDVDRDELYRMLVEYRDPITTARASQAEIFHGLDDVAGSSDAVLYLTAGSQYTGTFGASILWKEEHDREDKLRVLDSRAASGQLAILALVCARFARTNPLPLKLLEFAREQSKRCKEYIFLDTLKYLARGGRMSKMGAFFGDAFGIKPVIEHKPDGAGKAAVVRSRQAGLDFALEKIVSALRDREGKRIVLLEYTDKDSKDFVITEVGPRIEQAVNSDVEVLVWPMSATAGVHMGPGTWALAYTWV